MKGLSTSSARIYLAQGGDASQVQGLLIFVDCYLIRLTHILRWVIWVEANNEY